MSVLHLGVWDIPHPGGEKTELTTGDLAEILESKYGLYSVFVETHLASIAEKMADSLSDAIDNVLAGAPAPENPFAAAEQQVKADFIDFLDTDGMAKIGVRGVPTAAALAGVNHRLKIKRGSPRPSFIDTGTLRAATAAWVEKDGS